MNLSTEISTPHEQSEYSRPNDRIVLFESRQRELDVLCQLTGEVVANEYARVEYLEAV